MEIGNIEPSNTTHYDINAWMLIGAALSMPQSQVAPVAMRRAPKRKNKLYQTRTNKANIESKCRCVVEFNWSDQRQIATFNKSNDKWLFTVHREVNSSNKKKRKATSRLQQSFEACQVFEERNVEQCVPILQTRVSIESTASASWCQHRPHNNQSHSY